MAKKPAKDASAARPGVEGVAAVAWKAELTAPVRKDVANVGSIVAIFKFFDDADPSTVLHERQFSFPAATSNAKMREFVEAEGKLARDTHARAVQLAAAFPVGTQIDIPA